jgi:hypothetical protein
MQIDADARLAAGAGGVIRFIADAAGLEGSAVTQLQTTVIAACTETFEHMSRKHPHLGIDFTRFADRIEIALAHEGEDAAPAIGLDTIAGFSPQANPGSHESGAFAGVDRVQYETHGKEAVTRLTKYLGNAGRAR